MKIRLTLQKTLTIDLDDPDPKSIGEGWKEQILEALRDERPDAQIETVEVDELVGAIISVIDTDLSITIDDFELVPSDIKVEVLDQNGAPL